MTSISPIGSRLLPFRRAAAAPSSSRSSPLTSKTPASHCLRAAAGDPAYNLVLHSAPPRGQDFHWHLELLPRLAPLAGGSLGRIERLRPRLRQAYVRRGDRARQVDRAGPAEAEAAARRVLDLVDSLGIDEETLIEFCLDHLARYKCPTKVDLIDEIPRGLGGKIQRRMVLVKPRASDELFEKNRVENRLPVTRPFRRPPDPRFVEYRPRQHQRTVMAEDKGTADDKGFLLTVGGGILMTRPFNRAVDTQRELATERLEVCHGKGLSNNQRH